MTLVPSACLGWQLECAQCSILNKSVKEDLFISKGACDESIFNVATGNPLILRIIFEFFTATTYINKKLLIRQPFGREKRQLKDATGHGHWTHQKLHKTSWDNLAITAQPMKGKTKDK